MFSTLYRSYFSFLTHFKMSSAICFNLDQSGNGLKAFKLFGTQSRLLMTLYMYKNPFENIVGKGENAGNHMFSTLSKRNFNFCVTFIILSSTNAFNLDQSKI